ncbi:hypothetical protein FKP32DRAFT_1681931 [Trametes sanguinea]|nr:hypothetical protein FKP32DRAFT_1681931 [Trametes sanguinea]
MSTTNVNLPPPCPPDGGPEILVLPDPGQSINRTDRNVRVTELKITKDLTVKHLKDLLRAYGLPLAGKRDILLQRLREYGADPERWNDQFIPARRSERGDISERRAANSHSARRIISQFGTKEVQTEFKPKRTAAIRVSRPVQPLLEPVKKARSAWMMAVLGQSDSQDQSPAGGSGTGGTRATVDGDCTQPGVESANVDVASSSPRTRGPPDQARASEPAADKTSSVVLEQEKSRTTTGVRRLERRVVEMNRGLLTELEAIKSQLSCIHALGTNGREDRNAMPPPPSVTPSLPENRHSPSGAAHVLVRPDLSQRSVSFSSHTARMPLASTSNTAVVVPAGDGDGWTPTGRAHEDDADHGHEPSEALETYPQSSAPDVSHAGIPSERLMFFELDGERFAFDKTTVPNPPQVSFAEDIPRLFREWHQSELLVINGRGIPIKHWAWFYRKRTHIKAQVWDVIRAKWNKWKSIVEERERFTSDEAFWATYSDSTGKHLNQQAILAMLQGNRGKDNARDAAAARKFFGNDLTRADAHGYFVYRKRNVYKVCEKAEAIARKWRELLEDYPDIAHAWASMQASEAPSHSQSVLPT